jgi:hypothetical protein
MDHQAAKISSTPCVPLRVRTLALAAAAALAIGSLLGVQADAATGQLDLVLGVTPTMAGANRSELALPTPTLSASHSGLSSEQIAATEKRIEAERDQATLNFAISTVAAGAAFGLGAGGGTGAFVGAGSAAAAAATATPTAVPSPTRGTLVQLRRQPTNIDMTE